MAPYRMIAIDLDGTLLSPTGQVTPRVKSAVHKALQAGLLICFATGPELDRKQTVLEAVEHYASAVFVGGAVVMDTKQRVTLHRTLMQPELAAELCGFLEAEGHAALALQDTEPAGVDYLITGEGVTLNDATKMWMKVTQSAVHVIPRLGDYPHAHTIRVGTVAAPAEVQRIKRDMQARFGGRIMVHSLFVPAFDVEVLEVFDPAVNKWEGILHVARAHGIEPSEIIAIGDDVNDIAMLQHAGLGVAMGNAKPEALAVADKVIGTNGDEGLAQFLEELVASRAVEPVEG